MQKKLQEKNKRLLKTYGLSLEEFEIMAEDGCFICGKKDGRLCVDHVHIKGYKQMEPKQKRKYVRNVLCFYCNTSLKVFERTKDGERNRKLLEGVCKYFSIYPLKGEIE